MAAAIRRLQQDRELRRRMSAAARLRAEAMFDLQQMIDCYRTWYEELLEGTVASRTAA
jgi:glycosyltransferase involved in cell wall biosynthesis